MKRHLQGAEQQASPSNLTKYCACHAKWQAQSSHARSRGAKSVPVRRQASADSTQSATPATQIEPGVLKVPRAWGAESTTPATQDPGQIRPRSSPSFRGHLWRYPRCQYHACHARSRGAKSVPVRRQASADIYGGTQSATPATEIEPGVLKVPRLPREIPRRQIRPRSSPSFR